MTETLPSGTPIQSARYFCMSPDGCPWRWFEGRMEFFDLIAWDRSGFRNIHELLQVRGVREITEPEALRMVEVAAEFHRELQRSPETTEAA